MMTIVEDKTKNGKIYLLLDYLKKHFSAADVAILLACLLYWRWTDYYENEQKSIAEFNDVRYYPNLPDSLSWQTLVNIPPERFKEWFPHVLTKSLQGISFPYLKSSMSRLVKVTDSIIENSKDINLYSLIYELIIFVNQLPFESTKDFRAAGVILDNFLEDLQSSLRNLSGLHFTPNILGEIMVDLIQPQPGERIYDPCFGNGNLLLSCARRLVKKAAQLSPSGWKQVMDNSIFGVEKIQTPYVIAITRLVLAGIEKPRLELGDILDRPVEPYDSSGKFDCILADLPWGRNRFYGRSSHFPVKSSDLVDLFIQHIMYNLRPNGRAVITIPNNFLFKTGSSRKIRERLLTGFQVEGIIALPAGTYKPYSNIETNLLLIRRKEPADSVRFLRVPQYNYTDKEKNDLTLEKEAHLIAEKFRSGKLNSVLWEVSMKDIQRRDWDLYARRSGDSGVEDFFRKIQAIEEDIPLEKLENIAQIYAGFSYNSSLTTGDKNNALYSLIRVADVTGKKLLPPTLFLNKTAKSRIGKKKELKLKPGDILLTASGSIGKTGMVGESLSGAIPAKSIIIIRPKEGSVPGYLLVLLRSECYQKWLLGHARGATIQNLSVRVLKNLVVPLPDIHLQRRLAGLLANNGGDAAALLLRLLSGSGVNPIIDWLESSPEVQQIEDFKQAAHTVARMTLAEAFKEGLHKQREFLETRDIKDLPDEIVEWIIAMHGALRSLTDITSIPPGSALYSILESARLGIINSQNKLRSSTLPVVQTADRLSQKLSHLIAVEIEELLSAYNIEASISPSKIAAAKQNEIILTIKNKSSFPLRRLQVTIEPSFGSGEAIYLAEDTEFSIPLQIPGQAGPGQLHFTVLWQGFRLDEKEIHGEIPLAVKVESIKESAGKKKSLLLKDNPYNGQDPVTTKNKNMFFGRHKLLNQVKNNLIKLNPANVILLEGSRRSGKTSILNRIKDKEIVPGWLPVFCSFQAGGGKEKNGLPAHEIFALMTREIGVTLYRSGIQTWLPLMDPPVENKPFKLQFTLKSKEFIGTEYGIDNFRLYLDDVMEKLEKRRLKLLLMLDEFDKIQEGIEAKITSPMVPENLRFLVYEYEPLSIILTGSRRLKKMREDYWSALFGLGERIGVGPFHKDEARKLVTEPVKDRLIYSDAARDRVVEWCACRANLIQSLCKLIYDYAAENDEHNITVAIVDQIVKEKMIRENEHLRTLWDYARTWRRRLILDICARTEKHRTPPTLTAIESTLESYGIYIRNREELPEDVEELRDLDLLEMDTSTGSYVYRVPIPLVVEWIKFQQDPEVLKINAQKEGEEKYK